MRSGAVFADVSAAISAMASVELLSLGRLERHTWRLGVILRDVYYHILIPTTFQVGIKRGSLGFGVV
jgi:hypothetical protein